MRAKTASPENAPRPAPKQRKARETGVIALKGPTGLPRTGKRRAKPAAEVVVETAVVEPQVPAAPSASELKALRLARIRERARAKPAVEAAPEPQPSVEIPPEPEAPVVVVAEAPPPVVVEEAPPPVVVAEAPVVVEEAPPVVVAEAPPPAVIEITPVEPTPVERTLTATSHWQPWTPPPRPRRPRTAVGLIVRAVSTLLRWGLRR